MDPWPTQTWAGRPPSTNRQYRLTSLRVGTRIWQGPNLTRRESSSNDADNSLGLGRHDRMGNRHPASLLLLPDCHQVHGSLRKRLTITGAVDAGGIGDDESVAIEFSLKLA